MTQRLTVEQILEEARIRGIQMSKEEVDGATTLPTATVLNLLQYRAAELRSDEEALQRRKQNPDEKLK